MFYREVASGLVDGKPTDQEQEEGRDKQRVNEMNRQLARHRDRPTERRAEVKQPWHASLLAGS